MSVASTGAPIGARMGHGSVHGAATADDLVRFKLAAEHANDALFLADEHGRIVWANRVAAERTGYSLDEIVTLTIHDLAPHVTAEMFRAAFERARRGRTAPIEIVHRRKDGSTFPVEITQTVVELPEGRRLFSAARDVTERRQTEEALRRSEERYVLAARATSNAIWDWDLRTDRLDWNQGIYEVFGHAPGEVAERAAWWCEAIHPDDRGRVVAGIHAVIDGAEGGHAWRDEYRFRRGDGTYAIASDRGYVSRDADGRALRMIGAMVDVTADRAAEAEHARLLDAERRARAEAEAAQERTARLQALTAALARARTLDDVATVVVAQMVVALGARTGAMAVHDRGTNDLVLVRHVGFPDSVVPRISRQSFATHNPVPECFLSGEPIWVESRDGPMGFDARFPGIAPVWDVLGVSSAVFVPLVVADETVGVISFGFPTPRVFDDADRGFLLALGQQAALAVERARLFQAERVARHEAETANRAKSEFLAVMSHELRTPLNAIGGYAELMEMGIRGAVTESQREDLRRIQNSQRHLLGLINEVLNYAKLETGTVHFVLDDVRVCDTLSAAEGLIAPQARAKGLTLDVGACARDLAVRADADKLRQIVVNLLSNAVKFTDRGGRLSLTCEADDERVRLHVRDTGIGIPADKLEAIFEPFVQVRADLTRTAEGTGLGLAISRDLARGMAGELAVESAVGRGSTFTLTLPRA